MKKYFPYLIFASALLISITGSFFSIYGLGKLFGGHQVGATIIAFAFELGNIITAASLKYYWKFLPNILKIPLIIIVFILTIITSMGLYGYLSDGYQKTAMKDEIVSRKSNLVKMKKDNFEIRISDFKNELVSINNSIAKLTEGLNTNSQTQQIVKGQLITNVQVTSKKGIEQQLNISNERKLVLNSKIESLQDSVQRLELQMIELEANNENSSELGPLKYLAQLTNYPMNKIVNWLILLIVIVFQPLALMLILTSMFAFKNNHYLSRNSKKKSVKVPTESIKDKFISFIEKIKDKTLNKQPIINDVTLNQKPKRVRKKKEVIVIPTEEIVTIPVEPISEAIVPKKIRKKREPKRSEEIEPVSEIVPEPEEVPKKRKVVDTNLTADLADHIAKSLPIKKKV